MPQKSRYTELVLLAGVAFLAGWNYVLTNNSFALPHKSSLYSIKPVLQNDQYLNSAQSRASSSQDDEFHRALFDAKYVPVGESGDFNFHFLTPLMVSKYVLGCYGAANFSDYDKTDPRSWYWAVERQWSIDQRAAKMNATIMLNQWQYMATGAAGGAGNKGVCACIDRVVDTAWDYDDLELESGTQLAAHAVAQGWTLDSDGVYQGAAELQLHDVMLLPYFVWTAMIYAAVPQMHYTANYYDVKLKAFESEDALTDNEFHAANVEFCQTSAVPMHTIQYEGTVGIPVLVLAAQMCILLGLLHAWDIYIDREDGFDAVSSTEDTSSAYRHRNKTPNVVRRYTKVTFAIAIFVGYFYLASHDLNQFGNDNASEPGYRIAGRSQAVWTSSTLLIIISLTMMLAVEIVYEYSSANSFHTNDQGTSAHSDKVASMVDRVGADVPQIIGFALLGMAVLLQADVTNVTSVVGGVFILVCAGVLQHVSNLVKLMYESICYRLDASLVASLALLEDTPDSKPNTNVKEFMKNSQDSPVMRHSARSVLQFFGWTRLYIFVLVVALSISFFTIAHDTSQIYVINNLLDGQLILFVLAFIFSNVGFDMMFELMPFTFEKIHSDTMRLYFIVAYLTIFNLNQIMYIRALHFASA